MGWKNSNLRTELRIENGELKSMRVGVFLLILHSHFSILNSLVTEDDFAKAAGVAKVMVE